MKLKCVGIYAFAYSVIPRISWAADRRERLLALSAALQDLLYYGALRLNNGPQTSLTYWFVRLVEKGFGSIWYEGLKGDAVQVQR